MLAMKVAAILLLSTILVQARHVEKRDLARFDPSALLERLKLYEVSVGDTTFQQVFEAFRLIYDILVGYQPEVIALFSLICLCGVVLVGCLVFSVVRMIKCCLC